LPTPPAFLTNSGKEIYKNMGESLLRRGLLNEYTLSAWIMFCRYWCIWYDYNMKYKTIARIVQDRDLYRIAKDAGDHARDLLKEFGLTPIAMTRIATIIKSNPENNEYEDFLNE